MSFVDRAANGNKEPRLADAALPTNWSDEPTPTMGMQLLVPVTGIFTTFILAKFGSEVVAAFGVASRIEALAFVGIFAVSMAMTPFIALIIGAGYSDRIDAAINFGGRASIYIGLYFSLFSPYSDQHSGACSATIRRLFRSSACSSKSWQYRTGLSGS